MLLFELAKKFLFSKEIKSLRSSVFLIATFGIFFASSAVLIGLGVLSGYQKVYKDAVLSFSAHILVFHEIGLSKNDQNEIKTFLKYSPIKNVNSAYQFYEALAPGVKGFKPLIFKGVEMDNLKNVYPVQLQDLPKSTPNKIFVGKDVLFSQPQILQKGQLRYLTLKDKDGQAKTKYANMSLQGTFKSGYYDFDSKIVLMPLDTMQNMFFDRPMVSGIEIRLDNIDQVEDLRGELQKSFDNKYDILTWQELNKSLFEALKLDRTVVFSVSFLILIIASLNIFGFNFLFFIERKREFLILSALGLGLKKLRRMLMILSLMLGGTAVLAGSITGFLGLLYLKNGPGISLDPKIYFVEKIPAHFESIWFVLFFLGAIALCLFTSFLAGRVVLKRFMTANLAMPDL